MEMDLHERLKAAKIVNAGGGGEPPTFIEKNINQNGVYTALEDSADGYSKVTVDVPNTYTAEDEGKVVDNGALVAQTAMSSEVTENGTVDTTLYNSVTVNVPSGGVEFKNTPHNFDLKTNIDNLDVVIPYGCTSIASYAFTNCTGLTSVEIPKSVTSIETNSFSNCTGLTSIVIPNSVTSIASDTFSGCVNLEKIYVDKDEGTLSGSPWGIAKAQVIWHTKRYQSSCTEVASGTTLTGTVNATVGDLVVATFEIFGSSYSISEGWTLLGDGTVTGSGNYSQKSGMAYKIATSTTETFTITQNTSTRAFISMVSITGASIGSFSGYTAQTDGLSITMNKPNGLTIWNASTVWWGTGWSISNIGDNNNISTTRNLLSLDQSDSTSVTFTNNEATSPSGILAASLTITGIDNFWYFDD